MEQRVLVGGPVWLLVVCAVSGQKGISSPGDSGQSAAQRRRGIQGQCGVQSCEYLKGQDLTRGIEVWPQSG